MYNTRKLTDTVSCIGVNDRVTPLFESMWPLPNGVAYNCYLINDEKTALLDTVKLGTTPNFIETVETILDGKKLDYLIVNHVELDHAGEFRTILERYPEVMVVGNAKTKQILECYFGELKSFFEVKEGDEISLGYHTLTFYFATWVHWPEVMMTYSKTEKILFSADAFGTYGTMDGGVFDDEVNFDYYLDEMRRYYTNIVGKYSKFVQKALAKLEGVEIKAICPLHGIVWRENPKRVISLYDNWSRWNADEDAVVIIYGSMYGNTAIIADALAREISKLGVKDIRVYDVAKTHISTLLSEVWRCKGVVLGSCAYNAGMFPLMSHLTEAIIHAGLKDRKVALFGSYSWNGGGVRNLKKFVEETGWTLTGEPLDVKGTATQDKLTPLTELAKAFVFHK
ncbi:MAG: FprA family A-type flavoprotein [Bacteroidetes bacterium]|nr:FprA family A-type flavoprotein [Bacteroidota bacterium]